MAYGFDERDPDKCEFRYRDKDYEIDFCTCVGGCIYKAPFSQVIHVGTELIQIAGKCEPPKKE